MVERKLIITQYDENEKVMYASHQLEGVVWENYHTTDAAPQAITWVEFYAAFHQFHMLEGIMDIKKE